MTLNSIRILPLLFAFQSSALIAKDEVSVDGMRIWTEAEGERTIRGRIEGKRADGSEVRIMLENRTAIWIPVTKLSQENRNFIASWEVINLRLEAKTVAVGVDRNRWAATWVASTKDTADILAAAGSEKLQDRTIGITIDNRGTAQKIVVDVFWFGFPLNDKKRRYVCARASQIIQAPPEQRYEISCGMGYRYSESSLAYVHADFRPNEIAGLFVDSWSGHTFAGWAVRISNLKGEILGESATLVPLLGLLKDVPAPVLSEKGKM